MTFVKSAPTLRCTLMTWTTQKATTGASLQRTVTLLSCLPTSHSRFEEVTDEPETGKGQKRARESDATEGPTKAENKNKKQKAKDGKPVEVSTEEKKEKKEKKNKKEKKDKKSEETPKPAEEKKEKKEKTLAGDIVIQDAKIGTGPMAKKGNTVRMRYIGKLTNGKEFDKNVNGKPVYLFNL